MNKHTTHDNRLIYAARDAWLAAGDFRRRRDRFKRYTYGDQWSDKICDGPWLRSEREQIYLSGKQPYTNNLIRQLVKTVVGRFRVLAESRGYYSRAGSAPRMPELDARLLEEFLISGMAVQRIGLDGEVENVNPRLFFINAVKDPCCRDIELIGQCHDMSLPEVYARFGHGSLERISRLADIFRQSAARGAMPVDLGLSDDADFFTPAPGKCRVVEMWTLDAMSRLMCSEPDSGDICYRPIDELDSIHAENDRRIRNGLEPVEVVPDIQFVWNCRWYSPSGELLDSCRSPYAHGSHPYVLRLYPLTDGEIHPFVEDVIDQQRYINRLIMMIDKMMASAAKGVLLFPVDQLPEDMKWEEVFDTWARSDGVIPITGRGTSLPQQVVTPTDGVGAYRLLELQMKLFDNISGVGDALQGRSIGGTAGAALYDRQVENATIAMGDLLETFASLIEERSKILGVCSARNSARPSLR